MSTMDNWFKLGVGGAIGNTAFGIGNFISQGITNRRMIDLQKQAWQREDTAVQRRVADLKAAGLSPTLAAGGAAAASAPVQQHAPQMDIHPMEMAQAISTMAHQDMDIRRGNAQISLTGAEERAIDVQTLRGLIDMEWNNVFKEIDFRRQMADLNFNERTLEERVRAISQENELRDKASVQADLDKQISELNVRHQEIENIIHQLRISEKFKDLDQQDLDIAAKSIAVDQARQDRLFYIRTGLPSTAPPRSVESGIVADNLAPMIEQNLMYRLLRSGKNLVSQTYEDILQSLSRNSAGSSNQQSGPRGPTRRSTGR